MQGDTGEIRGMLGKEGKHERGDWEGRQRRGAGLT